MIDLLGGSSMPSKTEHLDRLFEQTKNISIWRRIFRWTEFKALSNEAYVEFKSLLAEIASQADKITEEKQARSILENDIKHLREKERDQASELSALKERLSNFAHENRELREENIKFRQTDEDRKTKYENDVANLNAIKTKIEDDRKQEIEEQQQQEIERLERQKETWANHQQRVQEAIKNICQRHTIEYVQNVPFRGTPDNTIKLCDEFIIFDAKSPASDDDLRSFPNYIKLQAESVRKYVKEENVKKQIFLVIPSNTVHVIPQFSFKLPDYDVFVVTLDVLEPIILSLKKIEDYEFAKELSPEDRDNICRVIGKFAHVAKRRIQIDHFLNKQSIELLP
jgi:hypothetical protein